MSINERTVEIPWALEQLPGSGTILDIGSCEAEYLQRIAASDYNLHCLDVRACTDEMPVNAVFHHQDLIGNTLPRHQFDAVMSISTIEHIGLAHYGQPAFANGDRLAVAEIRGLLKSDGYAIITVPVGRSRLMSWCRQYSPDNLKYLFANWSTTIRYWGFNNGAYEPIDEADVNRYEFSYYGDYQGAGAVAGVLARPS